MNTANRLVEAAALRRKRVEVPAEGAPVEVWCREPTALQHVEYRDRIATDGRDAAVAFLLAACVCDESGAPILDAEQALAIATGSPAVWLPLVDALTGSFDRVAGEKKTS